LAKTYHKIQQWDRWLGCFPGHAVLEAEKNILPSVLSSYYGNQIILIGAPSQHVLLQSCTVPNRYLFTPLLSHRPVSPIRTVESSLHELPVASGSIDLVLLPHILEFIDNPRQLLSEACRIIKPEGHIIITGFNPFSLWGLKKFWAKRNTMPWSGHFINASLIKKWLQLADFELMKHDVHLFRPHLNFENAFNKLAFLERIGRMLHSPFGGLYTLVAQAKVTPMTPIKLSWKQKISDVRLTTIGIPKPIARNHRQ
jgi:SAM-dependent methyltransferase